MNLYQLRKYLTRLIRQGWGGAVVTVGDDLHEVPANGYTMSDDRKRCRLNTEQPTAVKEHIKHQEEQHGSDNH